MISMRCITLRHIIVLGVIIYMMAVMCEAQNSQELVKRNTRKRFCGRVLTDALKMLCMDSGYYETKSIGDDDEYAYSDQPQPGDLQFQLADFPFISKMIATEKKPRTFRRFRRGIVEECCRKSCTTDELKTYCKN